MARQKKALNNGYLYVASVNKAYYDSAVKSAVSLKDNYPEAKIALFTHKSFINPNDLIHFDHIVTDIPIHKRAKMWAMARTPFDRTFYIDADSEIWSEKIADVFEHLDDYDLRFTGIIPHVSKDMRIDDDNILKYHGGVVLFKKSKTTISLMTDWFNLYDYQTSTPWEKTTFAQYDKGMQPWDQFTLWYLLNRVRKYSKLKHDLFPNGGFEYNYIYLLDEQRPSNVPYQQIDPVVYHRPISRIKQDNALHIKPASGSTIDFD